MATPHPDLTAALKQLRAAEPHYDQAEQFYRGTVPEVFASQKLRDLLGPTAALYRVNYARTPVDTLLERTKVQGWTCSNTTQQSAVEQVWTDNELGIEAKDIHLKGYEFGDSYLIAWPAEKGDPDFPGGVAAYHHGPRHVRVIYDSEKPRKKKYAVHRWLEVGDYDVNGLRQGDVFQRVNVYYDDRVERWVSKEVVQTATGQVLALRDDAEYEPFVGDGQPEVIPNEVEGVPVFHFRTARPYGRPEHADAYGPQHGINKLYSSLMGSVDHAVAPQRYALTESSLEQQTPDDAWSTEVGPDELTTESTTDGLDPHSSMETGPGNVWLMSGKNLRVGQFDAAQSSNFTEPLLVLVQAMADVTDIPSSRYHKGGNAPSGDAQRMSERPLNAKVDDRQAQYGVTWHEFAQWVCDLQNLGETDAQIAWAPPEVYTDKESWETAQIQLGAGVPFAQVMRERGYTTETVEQWMTDPKVLAAVAALVNPQPQPQADTLAPPSTP